jgi:hypothetical protein
METAIRENDFVIVICTPRYKQKADKRDGGVGYEGDIMTGEAFVVRNRRKFIPVLRAGEWATSAPSWLLSSYYVDLRGEDWEKKYTLLSDTILKRLPEPPPVQAQGFVILPTGEVYDSNSSLLWTNCREAKIVSLEELNELKKKIEQKTGFQWRFPTEEEVLSVKESEEYYPRPPIMVSIDDVHPFFSRYKKGCWTDIIVRNVREGDAAQTPGGIFNANGFAAGWSGIAQILGVDAFQVAQEAERLRRRFLARFVRLATVEDLETAHQMPHGHKMPHGHTTPG